MTADLSKIDPNGPLAYLNTKAPIKAPDNKLGKDAFLKLLVAQMKYQNPMEPASSTDFIAQTAQFTTVSTLQQIEKDQQAIQHTNQLLAASGMVGRGVTYSTAGIAPMTPAAP